MLSTKATGYIFLTWVEYTQNSLWHSDTNLTPFQCLLGYQPPLYQWNTVHADISAVDKWFRGSKHVWQLVHHRIFVTSASHITFADRIRGETPTYCPGQAPYWFQVTHAVLHRTLVLHNPSIQLY